MCSWHSYWQLTTGDELIFLAAYLEPLTYKSISIPLLYCFDFCVFILLYFRGVVLIKAVLTIRVLRGSYQVQACVCISMKIATWDFYKDLILPKDHFDQRGNFKQY